MFIQANILYIFSIKSLNDKVFSKFDELYVTLLFYILYCLEHLKTLTKIVL